jgi:hypothetical protein
MFPKPENGATKRSQFAGPHLLNKSQERHHHRFQEFSSKNIEPMDLKSKLAYTNQITLGK